MIAKTRQNKIGLPPGSLVYFGDEIPKHNVEIKLTKYNKVNIEHITNIKIKDFSEHREDGHVHWIDINGLHQVEVLKKLGKSFGIHSLVLEDILNTRQRPKVEIFEDYIFATLKMIYFDEAEETFKKEQISILLVKDTVITIHQSPKNIFKAVNKRISESIGRIRKMNADYLFYAILDSVIDEYFTVIERVDDELEIIEENIEKDPNINSEIHWLKKELLYIRRVILPVKDMMNTLLRTQNDHISQNIIPFLQDAYDHCVQVQEAVELNRDIVSGLIELHLSSINNKMNEVMKFLTVYASIFIPLTFITGIYGMNFEYMPELKWKYGYFALIGVLTLTGSSMYYIFKRKKWL